jgi:hypothetical protein
MSAASSAVAPPVLVPVEVVTWAAAAAAGQRGADGKVHLISTALHGNQRAELDERDGRTHGVLPGRGSVDPHR